MYSYSVHLACPPARPLWTLRGKNICRHPGLPTCIFVPHPASFLRGAATCQPTPADRARGAYTDGDSQLQVVVHTSPIKAAPRTGSTTCTSVICLPASDRRGLPASEVGSSVGLQRPRRCGKRVPLSHVLHRRRKTISASSLGPRLGPLCTAPTHEHSYYVNWALDRGISATTPGHNTGSRANARPSMPRQSSPRSRGFARFFPLFPHYLQRRGDQNKRKARATSTRGLLADFWLSGYLVVLAVWLLPPPLHPSGSWPTLDAVQIYGYLSLP